MMDSMASSGTGQLSEIRLSRTALKALASIPGMGCGSLSPLGRVSTPSDPPQRDALVAAVENMAGPWEWAMPALIDPFSTVSLIVGDGETTLLGQYVFPDVSAKGPGFKVFIDGLDLVVQGPVTIQEVEQSVLDLMSLAGVGEAPTLRLTMSGDQFWALNAVVDAYREAALRRRLSRQGGLPIGVSAANVVAAWEAGLAAPNPGWSVSLFSMMIPGSELAGFGKRLPVLLDQMVKDALLFRIEGDSGETISDLFFFEDSLDSLCQSLYRASTNLGLTVQRKRAKAIDMAMIGVWRTGAGLALADVGGITKGQVDLVVAGPPVLVESLETILGAQGEPQAFAQFSTPTPFTKAAILAGLSGTPISFAGAPTTPVPAAPAPAAVASAPVSPAQAAPMPISPAPASPAQAAPTPKFCAKCGTPLESGVKFCPKCGTNLQG
ncbi:MAG: zinc ribbon domain-containing protein [Dehalococcoidia bacterium]|nr:zinc ribbon domain-containing protein [Dehalococcoidia bacterium]